MKKFLVLLIVFMSALVIVACENTAVQDDDDTREVISPLTVDQMQHDPMSFEGQISVAGIVGDYGRFNFSLSGDGGDFELAVDYRGNQALPAIGTAVIATGRMNYRSCCGPHLISTRFEVVE